MSFGQNKHHYISIALLRSVYSLRYGGRGCLGGRPVSVYFFPR